MKPDIVIVGCGKVGTALGFFLAEKGYRIAGVSGRRLAQVREVAGKLMAGAASDAPWEVTGLAEVVFLAVPDGEIQPVCEKIAGQGGFRKGSSVLHLSGALSSEILSGAAACGVYTGSMHPLQSFAGFDPAYNPFEGIVVSAEGHSKALEAAGRISKDLGSRFLTIRTESKTLYHAAAVVASNYLVTVLDFAITLMEEAGMDEKDARDVLAPLIAGTLKNIEKKGTTHALTGPVSRGDTRVIRRHMEKIGEKKPGFSSLYKTLGSHTVDIALKSGSIQGEKATMLKELFEKPGA